MFLVDCKTHDIVDITDFEALFDASQASIEGRYHAGEEMQDIQLFIKSELMFQSGENLPDCWLNSHYIRKNLKIAA
ncbi:MAG: acetyltransferase [Pseudomonadota bacterium]